MTQCLGRVALPLFCPDELLNVNAGDVAQLPGSESREKMLAGQSPVHPACGKFLRGQNIRLEIAVPKLLHRDGGLWLPGSRVERSQVTLSSTLGRSMDIGN